MLNEEEIEERIKYAKSNFTDGIEILLEIIEQLRKENNKQNKIIHEMAIEINAKVLKKEQWCPLISKERGCYADDTCLKCLKQYFEKKVEEE